MSARILNLSEDDYHNDRVGDVKTLNYTTAATIVTQSPLHAYHQHPKLGGQKWEPTAAMDAGTVIHALLLEDNPGEKIQVVPFDDFRTNAAKAARDEIRAAGKTPVTMDKFGKLTDAANAIRARLTDMGILLDGRREAGIAWEAKGARGPVACRARLDHLLLEKGRVDEVKTTGEASLDKIIRKIIDQGYDVQYAAYTSAVQSLDPSLAGRVKFRFLFCEIEPPYAVTPVDLSGVFREYGERRWNRAVDVWSRCLAENHWPGYVERTTTIEPPPWILAREMEEGFDGDVA